MPKMEPNLKAGTDTRSAGALDLPAHQSNQLAGYGQTEPGSTMVAGTAPVHLLEGVEYAFYLVGFDARPRIPDLKLKVQTRFILTQHPHSKTYFALFGEFDRITQEVHHHLPQSNRITMHIGGQVGCNRCAQQQSFLPCLM